ncbi:MAG: GNAT family N-acetyltransferase [Bacteroidota bacterium]
MHNTSFTERLILRKVTVDDADFLLELFNTPSWLKYIGDRNIHTIEEAAEYIANGPLPFYAKHGFGSYCLELRDSGTRIGMCGLYKRDNLNYYDLGFALLPEFEGKGYAREACEFVLEESRKVLKFKSLLAITNKNNDRSIQLLERLGFEWKGNFSFENGGEILNCFQLSLTEKQVAPPLTISLTKELTPIQKEAVREIWNTVYPESLVLRTAEDFERYLEPLGRKQHYLMKDLSGKLLGWGITFERENDLWFAMILDSSIHGTGMGTVLLKRMQAGKTTLSGWVIDHNNAVRADGKPYLSPVEFYLKNKFTLEPETRLELPTLSAVCIRYNHENN